MVALALFLRAHRLGAQSLWSDEDITLDRALTPLAAMLRALPVEQGPLYYLLMRPWTLLAGSSDLALRWPSLLAAVLSVPLGMALGARLAGRRAGRFLGLILAVNPFLVYYGQEARAYALLLCLALATPLALLRAEDHGRRRDWIIAGLLAASTVLCHAYGVLALLPLLLWPWLGVARDRPFRGYALAGLAAALAYAPWLPRALGILGHEGWRDGWPLAGAALANLTAWSLGTRADWSPATPPQMPRALLGLPMDLATALYLVLGAGGLIALLRRGGAVRRALSLALLPLLGYAFILALTAHAGAQGRRLADYDPRYFMAGLAGFYLLVAAGAAGIARPAVRALAAALLALAALPSLRCLYTDPACQKPDYRALLAQVAAPARDPSRQPVLYPSTHDEDTVLLLDGPSEGLARRYRREGMPVKVVRLPDADDAAARAKTFARLEDLAGGYANLWLVEDGAARGRAAAWLDGRAYPVSEGRLQDWRLRRFLLPPAEARLDARQGAAGLAFQPLADTADGLDLGLLHDPTVAAGTLARGEADDTPTLEGVAGQVLALPLGWAASRRAPLPARLSLRLFRERVAGEAGAGAGPPPLVTVDRAVLAWWSRGAEDGAAPRVAGQLSGLPAPWLDRQGLALPVDLAPGSYWLEFRAYDLVAGSAHPVDRLVGGLVLRVRPPLPEDSAAGGGAPGTWRFGAPASASRQAALFAAGMSSTR